MNNIPVIRRNPFFDFVSMAFSPSRCSVGHAPVEPGPVQAPPGMSSVHSGL
jgi:hypothetical protein